MNALICRFTVTVRLAFFSVVLFPIRITPCDCIYQAKFWRFSRMFNVYAALEISIRRRHGRRRRRPFEPENYSYNQFKFKILNL